MKRAQPKLIRDELVHLRYKESSNRFVQVPLTFEYSANAKNPSTSLISPELIISGRIFLGTDDTCKSNASELAEKH